MLIAQDHLMSRRPARAMILSLCLIFSGSSAWIVTAQQASEKRPDPARFEKEIGTFEKHDSQHQPPHGAVLFTGSSSVKNWHKELATDFKGLTVLGRGFGGSNMNDLLHYMDKVVLKYNPRAVVVYEGDNDLKEGMSPKEIFRNYQAFYKRLSGRLPQARLYILAVKPSPERWKHWPKAVDLNQKLKTWADAEPNIYFIDMATCLLDDLQKPRKELYSRDNLHLNRDGYKCWRNVLAPALTEIELAHETGH